MVISYNADSSAVVVFDIYTITGSEVVELKDTGREHEGRLDGNERERTCGCEWNLPVGHAGERCDPRQAVQNKGDTDKIG